MVRQGLIPPGKKYMSGRETPVVAYPHSWTQEGHNWNRTMPPYYERPYQNPLEMLFPLPPTPQISSAGGLHPPPR